MQIVESTIEKWKLVSGPIGDVLKKIIHVVTEKNSGLYWFKVITQVLQMMDRFDAY
jgi:hypothetical protein